MPKVTIATSTNSASPSKYDTYWNGGYQIVYSGTGVTMSETAKFDDTIDPYNWMVKFSILGDLISALLKDPKNDNTYEDLINFLKATYK